MKLIQLLFVASAYILTGWFGLQIPFSGTHITLLWLPAGVAVAGLIVYGRHVLPGVFLGAMITNMLAGASLPLAVGIATGNTLAPFVVVLLLGSWKFQVGFKRKNDVGIFSLATCLGMLLSASVGAAMLTMFGLVPSGETPYAWLSWWVGDAIGVMLIAPLLLTLTRNNIKNLFARRTELLFWLLIAIPVCWFTFLHDFSLNGQPLPLAFVTLPLLAWAALSFGVTGAGMVSLGFSAMAALGTALRHGSFYLPDTHISLFLMWAYMGSTVLTGMLITALQAERNLAEETLRSNEKQLNELTQSRQAILDGTSFAVISTDALGIIQNFNAGAERMLGYTAAEMIGKKSPVILHDRDEVVKRAAELTKELGKPVMPGFEALVIKARARKTADEHQWTYIRKDRKRFPVLLAVNALINKQNDLIGYLAIAMDRSEYQRQESLIRDSEELFRVLYESSTEAHMLVTQDRGFIGGNLAAVKLFGCRDLDELLQLSPATTSPEFQHEGLRSDQLAQEMMSIALANGSHAFEWIHQKVDKSRFYAEILLTQVHIGGTDIIHAIVRDISLRKASDEEISKLAFYDALTGLPNRRLLMDRVKQTLASSSRNEREGALLFIDLDHFKNLNDTLGHDMGDLLLQEVGNRLLLCVRKVDTVARLGGDEFVVMLNDLVDEENEAARQVEKIGVKILHALNQPYLLNGNAYRNTPSIGVAMFSNSNDNISELMKQADLAMYQAKANGRNNLQFFDAKVQEIVNAHVALESELREAVAHNQFVLYYQPQVDSHLQVVGVEVLIRWRHAERGIISPAAFISLAETTGLINPIGQWVLETACAQLAVWATQPNRAHLTIAVNVSAIQFCSMNYVEQVMAVIARTGADPHKLKLEITESILLDDVENIIAKMLKLQAAGISFALDDFGTGYSSLAYLKRLPLNQLKIDQSFVRDVMTDPNDATFAKTIINLGQSLGLVVMAEGVETREQLQFLASHQCNAFQGYLFSRPLPLADFELFLDHKKW